MRNLRKGLKMVITAGRIPFFILVYLLFAVSTGDCQILNGYQFANGGPKPGDVYKEFVFTSNGVNWRVTDPNIDPVRYPVGAGLLPNSINNIYVDDLQNAVKAEIVIDLWGGHQGTTPKKFRVNGNAWITIPELDELGTGPAPGEAYMQQVNYLIDVPLNHLRTGNNGFEGTCGTSYFGWGQWGWYGIILRVYYNPASKTHATGTITYPTSNSQFGDNPTVQISTSGSVSRVDYLASYDGNDTDGDGVYTGYHHDYHRMSWADQMTIRNHVGTSTAAPYQVQWNTQWVPDQDPGQVKLVARILGANGYWYVSNEVTNLSFNRSQSVEIYKSTNVPQGFWVRVGQAKTCNIYIPTLTNATDARVFIPSWDGNQSGQTFYTKVNNWTTPIYGQDHFYSFDSITVPISALRVGNNTFTVESDTPDHGVEIMWPGPSIMVRYGSAPVNVAPTILQHPQNTSVQAGQTASFSISATGTSPLTYKWKKNGSDISGAPNSPVYTTPAVTAADNGATFSCQVSNAYGNVTSNAATLTVTSSPAGTAPSITQQPQSTSVQVGLTASFSIGATGSAPLTYKWKKNGSDISGAPNSATYTTPAVTAADNGATFSCQVSNAYGNVTSNTATLTVTTTSPDTGNVIKNPGFESGTASWNFYTNGSGSFDALSPGSEGAKAACIKIQAGGTNVQLFQSGIPLEPDTEYQLSFYAYSNTGRDMSVTLCKHTFPYTLYGPSYAPVALGSGWSNYSMTFKTPKFSGPVTDARLMFWLADADTPGDQFWIDNVVLTKGGAIDPPDPPADQNFVSNPGFESGMSSWNFYTDGSGSCTLASPGFEGSNAGLVKIATTGTNVQLYQYGIVLEPNTDYVLSFAAYSNTGRDLKVSLLKHSSPYTAYGPAFLGFDLTSAWATYTASFRTPNFGSTISDARLMFWLGDGNMPGDQFWVDKVVLVKK